MPLFTQLAIISVMYFVKFVNKLFKSRKQKVYCIHLPQILKESWRTRQRTSWRTGTESVPWDIRALSVSRIAVGILEHSVR